MTLAESRCVSVTHHVQSTSCASVKRQLKLQLKRRKKSREGEEALEARVEQTPRRAPVSVHLVPTASCDRPAPMRTYFRNLKLTAPAHAWGGEGRGSPQSRIWQGPSAPGLTRAGSRLPRSRAGFPGESQVWPPGAGADINSSQRTGTDDRAGGRWGHDLSRGEGECSGTEGLGLFFQLFLLERALVVQTCH